MINWVLVTIIPLAVTAGTEFNRRKQEAAGKTFSFLPRSLHLPLTALMGVSVTLFFEAARVSLGNPSSFNLWLLILSGVASQIALIAMSGSELFFAKRRLEGGNRSES